MSLALRDGSRVCIVGGGPAGSLAALHLLRLSHARGLSLDVTIFEPRDFRVRGPAGCNRCAGILSSRLLSGLSDLGLKLPAQVVRSYIRAYEVHLDGETFLIEAPSPSSEIVSVYRGAGPRLAAGQGGESFDGFLLEQACARGARHQRSRVSQVTWQDTPVVHAGSQAHPADLVVLATGVNSRPPLHAALGYRPPATMMMAQDEVPRPSEWPNDLVRIYFRHPPGLLFGAMIPKGEYLNISLLGRGLTADAVAEFLEMQGLSRAAPSLRNSLCGCTPRISVSASRGFYGDRWVAVGDAAVTRLYKDGIGSAFVTAQAAMETAADHGISQADFRRWYAPVCREISRDNTFGRWLYRLWSRTLSSPRVLRAWRETLEQEIDGVSRPRTHMRILWGMFTGDESYEVLLRAALSAGSLGALWRASRVRARA